MKATPLALPLNLFLVLVLATRVAESQAPSRAELSRKLPVFSTVKRTALCGRFEVPEVRSAPGGRRLALNVIVLPATTDSVLPDPLVFLAGGGVVPATRYAGFLTQAFPTLRRQRDILLVDQRGTWNSNPLACGDSSVGPSPNSTDAVREASDCMAELSARADLRAYSTAIAMDDLDAVREWLGYPALNLYGVSYGTKAAQVYLKQYPHRVRTAVLYGVVPIDAPTQLDLARFADHSLARVFALCAGDSECQAAFPGLPAEFDSVLGHLSRAPAAVTLERPDGEAQTVTVTDRMVRDLVQTMLGSARAIGRLPVLVHSAAGGDYGPIARALVAEDPKGPPPPRPAPRGLFVSILCGESIPLIDPDSVASATAGTFFGEAPVRSQMDDCAQWPRSELPAAFWEPARASAPVLVISGDLDPITPPSYGEHVASQLPNARHLIVANRSHGDVDPCITGLFERFILAGGAGRLDTTCTATPAHLSFVTDAEDLAPAH